MDLYNIVSKIPYLMMLGIGLMVILNLHIAGLNDLSADVDLASEEEYRQGIVLENLLNVDANSSETSVNYDRRRAMIPIDFVTNEDPSDGEAGFSTNNGDCYIERVPGLDGEEFAFGLQAEEDITENADNPESIECSYPQGGNSAWSPALIMREDNPPLEVIIHVYRV